MIKREKLPSERIEVEKQGIHTSTKTTRSLDNYTSTETTVFYPEYRHVSSMVSEPAFTESYSSPTFLEYMKYVVLIVVILAGLTYPWWKNFL